MGQQGWMEDKKLCLLLVSQVYESRTHFFAGFFFFCLLRTLFIQQMALHSYHVLGMPWGGLGQWWILLSPGGEKLACQWSNLRAAGAAYGVQTVLNSNLHFAPHWVTPLVTSPQSPNSASVKPAFRVCKMPRNTQHSLVQNMGPYITCWSSHCSESTWERSSHLANRRTPQTSASLIQIKHKNKWLSFHWKISGISTKIDPCVQHSHHGFLWINQCWHTVCFQLAPIKQHERNVICTWMEFQMLLVTFPFLRSSFPPTHCCSNFPP